MPQQRLRSLASRIAKWQEAAVPRRRPELATHAPPGSAGARAHRTASASVASRVLCAPAACRPGASLPCGRDSGFRPPIRHPRPPSSTTGSARPRACSNHLASPCGAARPAQSQRRPGPRPRRVPGSRLNLRGCLHHGGTSRPPFRPRRRRARPLHARGSSMRPRRARRRSRVPPPRFKGPVRGAKRTICPAPSPQRLRARRLVHAAAATAGGSGRPVALAARLRPFRALDARARVSAPHRRASGNSIRRRVPVGRSLRRRHSPRCAAGSIYGALTATRGRTCLRAAALPVHHHSIAGHGPARRAAVARGVGGDPGGPVEGPCRGGVAAGSARSRVAPPRCSGRRHPCARHRHAVS